MRIVAGLGNPGDRYASHRHNVGFMLVDQLASDYGFSSWKAKHGGLLAEGRIDAEKIILFKPQSYMNKSGLPVETLLHFYRLSPHDLIVVHDEIDLSAGKIRVKYDGGHGGHNGLRDIDRHISSAYWRLRIGVGRSRFKAEVNQHVLSDFDKDDRNWLNPLLSALSDLWPCWQTKGHEAFMTSVAQKAPPPQHSKIETTSATSDGTNSGKEKTNGL
jgi:PTH1 family peptidyl-tRNA hydrolase